jgi:hypothetical protein
MFLYWNLTMHQPSQEGFVSHPDALPTSFGDSKSIWSENSGGARSWGTFPGLQHLGGRGERGMLELQDGSRKNEKHLIIHADLHKPRNKLVNA